METPTFREWSIGEMTDRGLLPPEASDVQALVESRLEQMRGRWTESADGGDELKRLLLPLILDVASEWMAAHPDRVAYLNGDKQERREVDRRENRPAENWLNSPYWVLDKFFTEEQRTAFKIGADYGALQTRMEDPREFEAVISVESIQLLNMLANQRGRTIEISEMPRYWYPKEPFRRLRLLAKEPAIRPDDKEGDPAFANQQGRKFWTASAKP